MFGRSQSVREARDTRWLLLAFFGRLALRLFRVEIPKRLLGRALDGFLHLRVQLLRLIELVHEARDVEARERVDLAARWVNPMIDDLGAVEGVGRERLDRLLDVLF